MPKLLARAALLLTLTLAGAWLLGGSIATPPDAGAATLAKGKGKGKNKVHKAWPQKKSGRKPNSNLARRLARQVGPVKVKRRRSAGSAGITAAEARAMPSPGAGPPIVETGGSGTPKLLLVRSFDIPKDDKLYPDLVNYSWTYDNALATIGFVADKDRSQARQLLDQLAVLQNKNGSWDFAFDVMTGASAPVQRSGAVAWVALAGLAFAEKYGDKTYDAMTGAAIRWLLDQRNGAGLVKGGPDVSWVSTQHNLLAAEVLREAAQQTGGSHQFGSFTKAELSSAQAQLEAQIDGKLLVNGSFRSTYFRAGLNDDRIPADVQALGTMYLQSRGDERFPYVGAFLLQDGWFRGPRPTKAASNEVSGLRPFLDAAAPDVIWSEGTIEAQMALVRFKAKDTKLAPAVASLQQTIAPGTVGPIGADRDSASSWGEYRTWPTSAAASWLLMLKLEGDVYLYEK
jgi:hypothetical protein